MTINRTRELLGGKVTHLSNNELIKMNNYASILCDDLLDLVVRENKKSKSKSVQPCLLTEEKKHVKKR